MRTELTVCVIGLCAFSAGCNVAVIATRNLAHEALLCRDELRDCLRSHPVTDPTWSEIQRTSARTDSAAYARRFKAGSAEYADTGVTVAGDSLPGMIEKCGRNEALMHPLEKKPQRDEDKPEFDADPYHLLR